MGKRKYQAVRIASPLKQSNAKQGGKTAIQFTSNCPIPKLVPHHALSKEIKKIPVGTVPQIGDHSGQYIEDDENVSECFRDLREYLPRLASFYFRVQSRKYARIWFGKTEGTFFVAFGGDGCYFGEDETVCSFLVSFLNAGRRVASCGENVLVIGGNAEESALVVEKYIQAVCKQTADLEGKVIEIEGIKVTFQFQELPNDMTMFAMLGGELSNAATYFSTFANVSKKDCTDLQDSFSCDGTSKREPWSFDHRAKVPSNVEKLNASLGTKPISDM